jgi:NAD-dependent DNA ligase
MHRGLSDCIATHQIYQKLKDDIITHNIPIKRRYIPQDLKDIKATVNDFDTTHPFYGKYFVFSGALKVKREEAAQIVVNLGGINENSITKKTNYLVLGNYDYISSIKEGKSSKHKKAEEYILKGQDLRILSENIFFDMIGDNFNIIQETNTNTKIENDEVVIKNKISSRPDNKKRPDAKNKFIMEAIIEKVNNLGKTNPFYNKYILFNGTLKISFEEMKQLVANLGGIYEWRLSNKTNYLVLGSRVYANSIKHGKNTKRLRAEEHIAKGQDLKIINEFEFFDMIG